MDEIAGRVAEWQRRVERDRFAGDDPVVELVPRLSQAEVVARVLAAQRAGALLVVGGERFNPAADRADAALRGAVASLRTWGFAAARARLDEAAGLERDPVAQQRIALFKALTRHCSALIYVPIDEKLRLGLDDFVATLAGLDLLAPGERDHYRDEIDRLLAQREAASKGDPLLRAAWTLIRAHLAMNAGQDEAAVLWLLGLAAQHPASDDSYLAALTTRARQLILALIGLGDAAAKPEAVHPRELFNALVAHLELTLGQAPAQAMNRFALNEYIPADVEAG